MMPYLYMAGLQGCSDKKKTWCEIIMGQEMRATVPSLTPRWEKLYSVLMARSSLVTNASCL